MWIDRRLLALGGGVSLLLNVFLVGWVAGHGFAGPQRRPPSPAGPGTGPLVHQNHVKLLSPDERHRFNAAMNGYRPAIRAAREALRERRQAVEAAMTAPSYDKVAVIAGLAELRAADADLAAKLHAGLAEAMAELPPPARLALVARDKPKDDKLKDDKLKDEEPPGGASSGAPRPPP